MNRNSIIAKTVATLESIAEADKELDRLEQDYRQLFRQSNHELDEGGYSQETCEQGSQLLTEIHRVSFRIARLWDSHHNSVSLLVADGVNEGDKPPYP